MIGIKYVCEIYNKSYEFVGNELGITRQNVQSWIKGLRPIPKKHLLKLSEIFDEINAEYFIKELSEKEKLIIQKNKLVSECVRYGFKLEEI